MVVGGGAAGLEMVGELRHAFPEKPIGLVHRGKTLLPYYTKSAQILARSWCKEKKIEVFLETEYTDEFA